MAGKWRERETVYHLYRWPIFFSTWSNMTESASLLLNLHKLLASAVVNCLNKLQ